MKVLNLFVLFFVSVQIAYSQSDKNDINRNFDWICYNADSTINAVFQIKDGQFNGYAIFFGLAGKPSTIARFRDGKREGIWLRSDGSTIDCRQKRPRTYIPGCGTGQDQAIETFAFVYRRLLTGKQDWNFLNENDKPKN